jgi:pyruvate/2-oxoglutarate dehydrogenase complex dihydrolipoamide dehydrogenase (E3) component
MIAAAKAAETARRAAEFGVDAGEPQIDFGAVIDHVHSVIAGIAPHDGQERFEKLGVTVIRAAAAFTGPRQVRAGEFLVDAKHFVIATGSSPFVPPIEGIASVPYFTNETIFENRTRPEHLIVIGGGPIGVELAQAHRRLGAAVTIIEAATILGREDPDAVVVVRKALVGEGIAIRENAAVKTLRAGADGGVEAVLDDGIVAGSHLLVAVGRRPNVDGLDLDKAGVRAGPKGVETDSRLRTSNRRVYAVGDVAGGPQFTHLAGDHASTLIRNILFKFPARRRDALAPRVTYCEPEIASIGLSETEALQKHAGARAVVWPFAENDRARTEKRTEGFARIVADKGGRIVGATIVGENAGDLIAPAALALANGLRIGAFTKLMSPYPTRGEALKRAAGAWYTASLFSPRTRVLVRLLSMFD